MRWHPQVAQLAAHCHTGTFPGPHGLHIPFSFLLCLFFCPRGLAAGWAASTRNLGHSMLTKHHLSSGAAGLGSLLPSWEQQPPMPQDGMQ